MIRFFLELAGLLILVVLAFAAECWWRGDKAMARELLKAAPVVALGVPGFLLAGWLASYIFAWIR